MKMKIKAPLILVLLIFVSNNGCNSIEEKYPYDFAFKKESVNEIINSFDSTYQRSYSEGDSIVKIQFSSTELKNIYNSIIRNELDTYPDNYSFACESYIVPSFETKLQFRINGEFKNLTYKDDCQFPLISGFFKNRKYAKFYKTIKMIDKIVNSKPDVKRLSNTDIIFL
jgi:hypothetical protein